MPHFDEDNPHLVTPGVKWESQPGSFTHMTEFFGPLLAVMKAKNLTEAIWPGQPDRLRPDLRPGKAGRSRTEDLDRLDPGRQPVRQPLDHRRDRAAAAVRRHGQIGVRTRHQGRRPQLRGSADAVRGSRPGTRRAQRPPIRCWSNSASTGRRGRPRALWRTN